MSTLRHHRPFVALLGAALLSAGGYLAVSRAHRAPAASRAAHAEHAAPSSREAPTRPRDDAATGRWARYRLTLDVRAAADGREILSEHVAGTWTTTDCEGDRVEARLAATRLDVTGRKAPPAEAVAAPFVLVKRDGALALVGFPAGTPTRRRTSSAASRRRSSTRSATARSGPWRSRTSPGATPPTTCAWPTGWCAPAARTPG